MPFTGLDADGVQTLDQLLERLAAEGHGLMVVTHDIGQARRCDKVLVLASVQRAFGTPDEVLADSPTLGAVYARYGDEAT